MPTPPQPNNPLHGVTLEMILNRLVAYYGWETLSADIRIRCFTHDPSIGSSLKFLRRTPWARAKVEALYVDSLYLMNAEADDAPTDTTGRPPDDSANGP